MMKADIGAYVYHKPYNVSSRIGIRMHLVRVAEIILHIRILPVLTLVLFILSSS